MSPNRPTQPPPLPQSRPLPHPLGSPPEVPLGGPTAIFSRKPLNARIAPDTSGNISIDNFDFESYKSYLIIEYPSNKKTILKPGRISPNKYSVSYNVENDSLIVSRIDTASRKMRPIMDIEPIASNTSPTGVKFTIKKNCTDSAALFLLQTVKQNLQASATQNNILEISLSNFKTEKSVEKFLLAYNAVMLSNSSPAEIAAFKQRLQFNFNQDSGEDIHCKRIFVGILNGSIASALNDQSRLVLASQLGINVHTRPTR